MEIVGTIGGWGVAIVLGLIALLPRKGTIENTRIDQLQDDLEAERQERKSLASEVKEIQVALTQYQKRDLAWSLHYQALKQAYEMGQIPPWPDLPPLLHD